MPQTMRYEASGLTLPCDRCGLMARMNRAVQSADGGETWDTVQYRNPRTKVDRDARYCEACAKEVCGIFKPIPWVAARKAMDVLGREKEADTELSELHKEAEEAKKVVLRYLVQNDADQLTHAGHTAKLRTRTNTSFDKDLLAEIVPEEQLREATRTTESQFVVITQA